MIFQEKPTGAFHRVFMFPGGSKMVQLSSEIGQFVVEQFESHEMVKNDCFRWKIIQHSAPVCR